MKRFTNSLWAVAALAVALVSFTGCQDPEEEIVIPTPKISAVAASAVDQTAATITVDVKDAEEIFYAYYATAEAESVEKIWESVDASGETSVDIEIIDLEMATPYTVDVYAVNQDKKCAEQSAEFTTLEDDAPAIAVSQNEEYASYNSALIKFEYARVDKFYYSYYVRGEKPAEIAWNEVEVSEDGEQEILIEDLPVSIDSRVVYQIDVYAENDVKTGDVVSNFFQIEPTGGILAISEIDVQMFSISMKVDILEEFCEGFAYTNGLSEYHDDSSVTTLEDDAAAGWTTIIEEDVTLSFGTEDEYSKLQPNSSYTMIFLPVKDIVREDDGWGGVMVKGTAAGDAIVMEKTTAPFATGASSDTISIALDEESVTLTSASFDLTRDSETCYGAYYGFAPASEVVDGDVAAWMLEKDWYNAANRQATRFAVIDYDTYEWTPCETIEAPVTGLSYGSEYYFFAFPVSEDGVIGTLTSAKFSTADLDQDASVKPESLTIAPAIYDATASVVFGENCETIYYVNDLAENFASDADAQSSILINMGTYNGKSVTKADYEGGAGEFSMCPNKWVELESGAKYKFCALPVAADGTYGEWIVIDYTTLTLSFDSSAAATAELTEVVVGDDVEFLERDFTVSVELNADAVGYKYSNFDESYVLNQESDIAFGKYAIEDSWNTKDASADELAAGEFTVSIYSGSSKAHHVIVVIPYDATGAYGQPAVVRYDKWETDHTTDGGSDGGEVDPKM